MPLADRVNPSRRDPSRLIMAEALTLRTKCRSLDPNTLYCVRMRRPSVDPDTPIVPTTIHTTHRPAPRRERLGAVPLRSWPIESAENWRLTRSKRVGEMARKPLVPSKHR